MGRDPSAQLEELQSELAFQGDTLQALNDALARQQADLLRLQRQVELLQARLAELLAAAAEGALPPEPRPPHY
jgi:SlyX protein